MAAFQCGRFTIEGGFHEHNSMGTWTIHNKLRTK